MWRSIIGMFGSDVEESLVGGRDVGLGEFGKAIALYTKFVYTHSFGKEKEFYIDI